MFNVNSTNQRDVWLVKVPKYIASSWKTAPQKAELGKLMVPKDAASGPVKFVLDPKLQQTLNTPDSNKLPSEHVLRLQPLTNQRMVVLSQDRDTATSAKDDTTRNGQNSSNPQEISFEGHVKFRGELRPTGDMSYMSLKTSLIKQAAKPTKVTQILDKAVTSYKPRGAAQLAHEASLRKKKEEAKRTIREDKEIVQARLFAAFEKQQHYNIKDLVRITNQSIPYLKEILKELCNYCSKSKNWELKAEYRHYKQKG